MLEPLLAYLTGPTAVGKSDVALLLAERHHWAILSIDSRQIYRRLDAGTAKPSRHDRQRAVHRLIDRLDPIESCSAGTFRRLALEEIEALRCEGRRALAVGGAGLYWEALAHGLDDLPPASPEIRARHERILAAEGCAGLYRRLREVDPETAARLAPGDRQRIGRALEVAELAGEPLSRILDRTSRRRQGGRPALPCLAVATGSDAAPAPREHTGIPVIAMTRSRPDLHARIEARCERMLAAGLLAELRSLLAQGLPPEAPGLRTVGYREFLPHLLAGAPLAACTARFLHATRQYAKRQETWLRGRVPERLELFVEAEEPPETTSRRVEEILRETARVPRDP